MSKILEKPPIFISSIEEIKKMEPYVLKKQIFEFKCTHCVSIVDRPLKYLIKHQYTLMCEHCCQGFKTQQTKLKRYGNSNYNNFEKYKQTCLKRYGVENSLQNKDIKEKYKQTCLEKYGVENPSQSEEIKKKKEKTTFKHYGVKNPTYIEDHIEKTNQTSLEKYGTLFPSQNFEIKEKAKNTCLKKYGFKSSAQNSEVKKKLSKSLKETISKRTEGEWREIRRKACKKYNYEDQMFDSSWELALWIYAKDHNEEIEREPCCFEYEYEEINHKYFPDFKYKEQLIEIKGDQFFKEDGSMQNPFDSSLNNLFEVKHQCGIKNNVQFWTFKEISPYLKYIEEKYGKGYLEKFKS